MDKSKKHLSTSNPDITTADKDHSRYPPGFTVDELWRYRKRRPPDELRPHDNLRPEEGSYESVLSEYKNQFKDYYLLSGSCGDLPLGVQDLKQDLAAPRSPRSPKPEDSLRLEGSTEFNPEYYDSFRDYSSAEHPLVYRPLHPKSMENLQLEGTDGPETTEVRTKYVTHPFIARRPALRRPTNLKLEGELLTVTEQAEKFVQFLLTGRTALARRSTTLKLEGDMDIKTENRDKYVPFEPQKRPPLYKKDTNLHLEGSLDLVTEKRQKFLPFDVHDRRSATKREANLHLEGELQMQPEYREVYVEYKVERAKPSLPVNNLRTEGSVDLKTETTTKYHEHPAIPFLRGSAQSSRFILGEDPVIRKPEYKENFIPHASAQRTAPVKPDEHLRQEGGMETTTESQKEFVEKTVERTETKKAPNNLLLEGRIDMNPEYRNAYVDYSRGSVSVRSSGGRRRREIAQRGNLRAEGELEIRPEYRSSYVDFPRERPRVRRPECSLSSEGEYEHTTEKNAQYIRYPATSRTEPIIRAPELKLEGPFECQPEYRKAYIDYLIRERLDRKPRPLENLGKPPQRAFEVVGPKMEAAKPQESPKDPKTAKEAKEVGNAIVKTDEGTKGKLPQSKSLSRIESSVFGPKLQVPTTPGVSRSPSPVTPRSRRGSISTPKSRGAVSSRRRSSSTTTKPADTSATKRKSTSKFSSPVRVENLASISRCPSPVLPPSNTRSRWENRERNLERSRAFIVLDNKEVNNNVASDKGGLYKEQKWMSPWYNPPS